MNARRAARENLAKRGGRKRTPEEAKIHGRRQSLRRNFDLTPEEYDDMFQDQNGLCAICLRPERTKASKSTSTPKRLAVDHDHASDRIRGLLCASCNTGLGLFEDRFDLLEAALDYLRTDGRRN